MFEEIDKIKSIIAYLILKENKGTAISITYQELQKVDCIDVSYKEDPYLQTVIVSLINTNA